MLGLHAEILVRVEPKYRMFEKELKMAGDKNKHTILALPLFTGVNNFLSADLSQ